jgi:hypothetical protein
VFTEEILRRIRRKLDDEIGEPTDRRWSNEEIIDDFANQAERDFCRHCRGLIVDSSTVNETLAAGTITLAGAAGSINSVTINGVTVTSGPVPFDVDLPTTAGDLAANINAFVASPLYLTPVQPQPPMFFAPYVNPQYSAVANGAVVTITALAGTGSTPNGYVIATTSTVMTTTCTPMAGGSALCRLYFAPGQMKYQTSKLILEIVRIKPYKLNRPLEKTTSPKLDRTWARWERAPQAIPRVWLNDMDSNMVRIVAPPGEYDTAEMTVWRLPLQRLSVTLPKNEPEIPEIYQEDMFPRILQYCFEKNDEETFKPTLAAKYEAQYNMKVELIKREILRRLIQP